jgi:hypothetical protein
VRLLARPAQVVLALLHKGTAVLISVVDPDPHHFGILDPHPDPHQIKIMICIKVISWIRNWIQININFQRQAKM